MEVSRILRYPPFPPLLFLSPPFPLPLLSTKEFLCRHGDDRAAPKINLESKVIRNWEDKAQRVLLNLLLQRALSMVMKGQRDGEPSCSSPDCVQVSCLILVVSRLIHRYQTRYPVSRLVSGLVPGIWVSWLGVRPGTRRYQAWYLVSGYHGWYSHVSDLVLRYQG
uniref:Uncharacterized protein n=1 Tax=Oryza nivara TaxID=4536 RepID=A0A0E0GMR2_ORYNI